MCKGTWILRISSSRAAFPLQNLTLAAIKKYTVDVGASVTLPCAYDTPGILTHRYHVDWYRGMEQVMVDANARRYTVSDVDFSLTIHNATIADASRAYFCELRVENLEASSDFVRVGPTFELEVKSESVYCGMLRTHAPCFVA